MISTDLQDIANAVIRRARQQGSVAAEEVQAELARAGERNDLWKDVLALARPALSYRQGRYHYLSAAGPRLREEQQQQQKVRRAVRQLVRQYRADADQVERRRQDRFDFIQPVQVETEDGRSCTLLSRDLSPTGIRLIGTRRLLGQKVRVRIPCLGDGEPVGFLVRILWTCAVGDDLFENGGTFLEAEVNHGSHG
jgi:hypothetical protein